jgi:hypothetical protein
VLLYLCFVCHIPVSCRADGRGSAFTDACGTQLAWHGHPRTLPRFADLTILRPGRRERKAVRGLSLDRPALSTCYSRAREHKTKGSAMVPALTAYGLLPLLCGSADPTVAAPPASLGDVRALAPHAGAARWRTAESDATESSGATAPASPARTHRLQRTEANSASAHVDAFLCRFQMRTRAMAAVLTVMCTHVGVTL